MTEAIEIVNSEPEVIELQVDFEDVVSARDAEAWAVGQRGGVDVEADDPTYHNNAKYYSEHAESQAAESIAEIAAAAEEIKDEVIASIPADYTNLTNQVTDLKTAKAPCIYSTASGSIASFPDGADGMDVKSLSVDIDPVQDLHGQDAPYPAGGGKNQVNFDFVSPINSNGITITKNDDGSITVDGTASSAVSVTLMAKKSIANGAWTISGVPANAGGGFSIWARNDASGFEYARTYDGNSGTVNITTGTVYIYCTISEGTTVNNVKVFLQLESGSTASAWSPYSNICPITGHSSVTVTRTGVNQFDQDAYFGSHGGVKQSDGSWYYENVSTPGRVDPVWVNPGYDGQITMRMTRKTLSSDGSQGARFIFVYTDGSSTVRYIDNSTSYVDVVLQTNASKTLEKIMWDYGTVSNSTWFKDVAVTVGSTAVPFVPYQGVSVTIPIGQTVYGGTLDVTSGTLTVDRAIVDLGTLDYTKYDVAQGTLFRGAITNVAKVTNDRMFPNFICSSYPVVATVNRVDNTVSQAVNNSSVDILDNDYLDATEFKSAMSGVQLCYGLATPVVVENLTVSQIETLKGVNNLFSTTGAVSVDYPADTKTYIDNRINASRRLIAGIETGFVASKAYSAGDMLIIGDDLYKVASSIASGATITVGTNVTKTTVAEQLIALANA